MVSTRSEARFVALTAIVVSRIALEIHIMATTSVLRIVAPFHVIDTGKGYKTNCVGVVVL